ncbi:MAG: PAS domain S-box protein, partial [Proteobacteria bacterium]|nr:PAS domain S-box protein [Pseudomonadota bacterium]
MADKPTYEELISKIRDLEEKVQHYEEIEKTTKEKKGLNDRSAFQLSMFLENTEDYIMIADENGISQYFNSAYAKIMKELVNLEMEPGIQPHKLLDDSKEIEYWDGLHQRVLSGEKFKAEYSHQLDNGDVLYFEFSFCPIYQEGKIKGFTEIARDITKHKQTEDALRENEVKYRTLFESNNFLTYLTDSKGNILLANNCGANFFELTPETIIGKSFFELRPDRAEMYQGVIDTILSTGKTQEFETLYPTPKKDKWLSVTVTPLKIQKDERLQIVTQDITKRKRSEEILKESEERYHDIFDNLMDVYFKTNLDGTIENVSPSAKIILGYSEAELIGKKTDMLYQSPKDREGLLYTLKEKGQVRGFELLFKKKTGEPCHISVNADLNYNKNGEPLGLTGTLRDITEHKKAENERIRAQEIASENEKLALVGRIAGKMAHDFNNVLGIIMGNTELSLLDCQDSLIKKTLELIYEQTIRGKNLTKNLVAFAKDQELKQEFFRINEKIDLVINLMRKDLEGIELIKKESPGIPELLADPGMIEHALVNLIQNSIHAMSKVEYPKITIITYSSDNHICFEIED